MKQSLTICLSLALAFAPALPALADEAPAVSPAAASPTADSAAATSPTAAVPELPQVKEGEAAAAPEAATPTDTSAPKETLVTPGAAKPEVVESPYKLKNFVIGFLGGALAGGAAGLLFFSQGTDGYDSSKAQTVVPAGAIIGGLGFGLASYFLGTTTPEEAKPPKVESRAPLAPAPIQQASLSVRYDWRF